MTPEPNHISKSKRFSYKGIPIKLIIQKKFSKIFKNKYIINIIEVLGYSLCIYAIIGLFFRYNILLFFTSAGLYFVYKEIIADIIKINKEKR